MALALTYDSTLSRVRIDANGLAAADVALVQQSTDQITWSTVRGGTAVPVTLGVMSTLDSYEFAPDVANYYRVVPSDPPAGLYLPGTAGAYASTPDTAALDITGDIQISADVTLADWSVHSPLVTKWMNIGNQLSFWFGMDSGRVNLWWTTGGTGGTANFVASTVPPVPINGRLSLVAILDVDNGAGGWTVTFFTAPTGAGPFTQLDAVVTTAGVTSIFAGSAALEVGSEDTGLTVSAGTVHSAGVFNGIGGTAVANPDFAAQPTGTTSFADAAGRTWTINGTAAILGAVLDGPASITPTLTSVWLKSLARPFLNREVTVRDFSPLRRPGRGGTFEIVGRSFPVAVTDVRGSKRYTLELNTYSDDEADNVDLLLASGDILLVHVPTTGRLRAVPGGYVAVQDTEEEVPPTLNLDYRVFSVGLTQVAAPGADVLPAIGTCQSVINTYATCSAVLAAHSTCADLLDLVGSPADVIVA